MPPAVIGPAHDHALRADAPIMALERMADRHMGDLLRQAHCQAHMHAEYGMTEGRGAAVGRIGLPAPAVRRVELVRLTDIVADGSCHEDGPVDLDLLIGSSELL